MSLPLWTRLFNWKQIRRSPSPSTITVATNESSSTVDKGTTRVVRVTVLRTGARYTGTLTPSTDSLPSGVTSSFSPSTLSPSDGFTDMTLTADAGAGSITDDAYTVTISGTGINAKTVNQTITVPDPLPPQSISIAPDNDIVSVTQGTAVDVAYTLTRVGAYAADVTLAITGLPTGVTVSYPNGATYSGSDQVKVARLSADISAPTVTTDAYTATAAGAGVTDATDNGTVTVTAASTPSTPTPLYYDGFDTYANSAALYADVGTLAAGKRYNAIAGTGIGATSLDTSVTYKGNPTVRGRFWSSSGTTPGITANGTRLTTMWWRWSQRWDPGFSLDFKNGYTGGKAHKMSNASFNGLYGRVLHAWTNGVGTPGATSGNDGDFQLEGMSKTGANTFVSPTIIRATTDGYNMFHDGEWYEVITYFNITGANSYELHSWMQRDGLTPVRRCSIRIEDLDQGVTTGLTPFRIMDTFNNLAAGPPPSGVDQSTYIGDWQIWNGTVDADPLGIGTTIGTDVDFTAVLSDNTVDVARGSSTPVTMTFSRSSGLATKNMTVNQPTNMPSGVSISYTATTITPAITSITVTVSATAGATPGAYTRNINVVHGGVGGQGARARSIPITITVT